MINAPCVCLPPRFPGYESIEAAVMQWGGIAGLALVVFMVLLALWRLRHDRADSTGSHARASGDDDRASSATPQTAERDDIGLVLVTMTLMFGGLTALGVFWPG